MTRTLVTGATGLLGNNVVRELLQRGESVRVLIRAGGDPRPLAGLDVEIEPGDVRDAAAVAQACQGVTRVVHCAARVHLGWTGLAEAEAINVEGTRHVALAARDAGARMVHVSSTDACGLGTRQQPADEETPRRNGVPCPYVVTKRAAEEVILELTAEGLDAVIVNPSYMLGPWDWKPSSGRMLLRVAQGGTPITPRGGNNFCDVRDVAQGALAALERGQTGRRYILGGESMTYLEAFRIFARVTGQRRPLFAAGPMMMIVAGHWGDLCGRITGREPDLNSAAVALARQPKYCTHARATAELGYQPGSVEAAAEAAWSWFKEHGYAVGL